MDLTPLIQPADTKILLIVLDGLGGYADADHGTELEEATTPHLDALVREGTAGLVEPVGPGITPGSGPGHLGLFGYDPEQFALGRGALSAAGLDFELRAGDVAARGNLASLDADGIITDRRAGRIPDPEARAVVERLQAAVSVPGIEVHFRHEREHRVLVVLRGPGLDPRLSDTDPQHTDVAPLAAEPLDPEAKRTADLIAEVDAQIRTVLADDPKANVVLFRGFDTHRELPGFDERFGLRAAAVAIYPMYRGIARLLGMDVLGRPADLGEQLDDPARVLERLRLLLPAPQVHRLRRRRRRPRPQDQGHREPRRRRPRAARAVTRRDRGERRPLHPVADGGALVAPGARAAVERAVRA